MLIPSVRYRNLHGVGNLLTGPCYGVELTEYFLAQTEWSNEVINYITAAKMGGTHFKKQPRDW